MGAAHSSPVSSEPPAQVPQTNKTAFSIPNPMGPPKPKPPTVAPKPPTAAPTAPTAASQGGGRRNKSRRNKNHKNKSKKNRKNKNRR